MEISVAATVERMKAEILADMEEGIVPEDVASFSDLHDHVDANEYGGFCDDKFSDAAIKHFGGRDANEGMPDAFIDFMNDCQDAVGEWLQQRAAAQQ